MKKYVDAIRITNTFTLRFNMTPTTAAQQPTVTLIVYIFAQKTNRHATNILLNSLGTLFVYERRCCVSVNGYVSNAPRHTNTYTVYSYRLTTTGHFDCGMEKN